MNIIESTKKLFGLGDPVKRIPDPIWKRKTCKSCEFCMVAGCMIKHIRVNRTDKACEAWKSKK